MTTTAYELCFSFFGLQRNPFNVSPDLSFFFSTPAHESLLAELLFVIQARQGLMLLTGETGSGKDDAPATAAEYIEPSGYLDCFHFLFKPRCRGFVSIHS